jgi:hypothetical protein
VVTSFVLLSEKNQKKLKEKVKEYKKTMIAQK